ncbi:MAG: hypothetical protein QW235_01160 [Pyrobaculum sp.]
MSSTSVNSNLAYSANDSLNPLSSSCSAVASNICARIGFLTPGSSEFNTLAAAVETKDTASST